MRERESEEFYYFLKKAYKIITEIDIIQNYDIKKKADIINNIVFVGPRKSIEIIIETGLVNDFFRKQLIFFLKKIKKKYNSSSIKNKKEIESVLKKIKVINNTKNTNNTINIETIINIGELIQEMDVGEIYAIFIAICSSRIYVKEIEETTKKFLIEEGVDF